MSPGLRSIPTLDRDPEAKEEKKKEEEEEGRYGELLALLRCQERTLRALREAQERVRFEFRI